MKLLIVLLIKFDILDITSIYSMNPIYIDNNNTNTNSDPVRCWPSGVPQTWTILSACYAAYRFCTGNPRAKTFAAF